MASRIKIGKTVTVKGKSYKIVKPTAKGKKYKAVPTSVVKVDQYTLEQKVIQ